MRDSKMTGSRVRLVGACSAALCLVSMVACSGGDSTDQLSVGGADSEIIGGSEVPADRGKFVAALFQDFGGQFYQICGGTFIAEDVVLTAAHCSFGVGAQAVLDEQNQQVLGATDPTVVRVARRPASIAAALEDSELIEVERIYVHPEFDFYTVDNDVAVWKLKTPSPGPVLKIASQAVTRRLERRGGILRALGYGVTDAGTASDVLMQVGVPFIDHDVCRANYYEAFGGASQPLLPEEIVSDNMLCAGRTGKDTCQGDSGGPLTIRTLAGPRVVGLTSWGIGCALPGLPGVYTRASNFRSWVEDCVSDQCDSISGTLATCLWGFSDCDGDAANGCEANTLGESDCGACGAACGAGEACVYDWDLGEPTAHCAPAAPLEPLLECVYDPGDGSGRIASFGYESGNEDTVFVRRGPENRFTGIPGADETLFGFPGIQEFRAGRYGNAPIAFLGSDLASWTLTGPDGVTHEVQVDDDAPACDANPLEQPFEQPKTAAERAYHAWKRSWQRPR